MNEVHWIIAAFAAGSLFGVSLTVSAFWMLITETPLTIPEKETDGGYKYD